MLLVPLDSTVHNVADFASGNTQCDNYLWSQAKKAQNKCLVMSDGRKIQAFGRYHYKMANFGSEARKVVWIDYLARDQVQGRNAGMEMLLRLLIRIHKDPRSHEDGVAAIMIDSLNCGDLDACNHRWRFFIQKAGFAPFSQGDDPFGYAVMPISDAFNIAIRAEKGRD